MLRERIAQHFTSMQEQLFPGFEKELNPTTNNHLKVIVALDVIDIEKHLSYESIFSVGRPKKDRLAIAHAFIAKSVLNIPTTVALIDRLKCDIVLRRICGFEGKLPCEGTFSNAGKEFSVIELAYNAHMQVIEEIYDGRLIGHVSRDSTAINSREKPVKKQKPIKEKRKRGRPKKGEETPVKEPTRLKKQRNSNCLDDIVSELPKDCDVGGKKNSKGNTEWWIGYKLHLDVDDHGIPLSAILTSASMHDTGAAIPLERMTSQRTQSLYTLMDAGYVSAEIEEETRDAGKIPIIDPKKPRGGELIPLDNARAERYKIRTTVERTNATIKDDFGGRYVRVKGHAKVFSHLMFGVLAMSALRIVETFS